MLAGEYKTTWPNENFILMFSFLLFLNMIVLNNVKYCLEHWILILKKLVKTLKKTKILYIWLYGA